MTVTKKYTDEEIQEMLAQYADKADQKLKDQIVLQYTSLVESICRRFLGSNEPFEDLVQEGFIGLIAAVDRYDIDKGVKFSTYATHFIIGQIKHYLRDKGKIIKEPAWLQELNQKMSRVIENLQHKLGRHPTEKEIGEVMHMPERLVVELLTTREVFKVASLEQESEITRGYWSFEKFKDDSVAAFQLPIEDKVVLETALERLKNIERKVITDYFYKGLNQSEIAERLGISCNYVSHVLRNGTKKLRRILTTEEIKDGQIQRSLISSKMEDIRGAWDSVSVIDALTGLYNRQYFVDRLSEEASRARREKDGLSILLFYILFPEDIDERILGPEEEPYLRRLSEKMRNSIRKLDIIARVGQVCFGVILPHTTDTCVVVIDRLTGIVEREELCKVNGKPVFASVRTGKAIYPADADDARLLLEIASADVGLTWDGITPPIK